MTMRPSHFPSPFIVSPSLCLRVLWIHQPNQCVLTRSTSFYSSIPNPSFLPRNDVNSVQIGKSIETLRTNLPLYFKNGLSNRNPPIYHPDICLSLDWLQFKVIHGLTAYLAFLQLLRYAVLMMVKEPSFKIVSMYQPSMDRLRIRWTVKGTYRWWARWDRNGTTTKHPPSAVLFDGISLYRFHLKSGLVNFHQIERIDPSPRRLELLFFLSHWWNRGQGRPVVMDLSRVEDITAHSCAAVGMKNFIGRPSHPTKLDNQISRLHH